MTHRIFLLLAALPVLAQSWDLQPSGTTARLRGVSAVDASTAWASGAKGTVLRTTDGGRTWTRLPVPQAETLDFRDIEARSAMEATVLSIGPGEASRILHTMDGGRTWTETYRNRDPRAFYDAVALWPDGSGLAMGDPVAGRFTLLRGTAEGAWRELQPKVLPTILPGESAFAASGTCLVTATGGRAWMGSGGAGRGRVYWTTDQGTTWEVAETPIPAANDSSGIFGLAFQGEHGAAVGGDYRREAEGGATLALTTDGGRTWMAPSRLRSFRSGVAYLAERTLLAVGPKGTDLSRDGGLTWTPLGEAGFHAVSAQNGVAWGVGEEGRIGRMSLK